MNLVHLLLFPLSITQSNRSCFFYSVFITFTFIEDLGMIRSTSVFHILTLETYLPFMDKHYGQPWKTYSNIVVINMSQLENEDKEDDEIVQIYNCTGVPHRFFHKEF